ncbi:hypothetical protein [Burkholderia sp. SCN-KJ]|uniref:hypothetical protein n=1 Tax=Burkholderia sp. SCN-KJ TaxID=2969248 RepID=UPI00214FD2C1|nr:hypothetical protein [Burkholderia sp. SCN-KJ]MCR4468471.1 hypothetical protein [Burkholderia sp. SCN-KJ]
MVAIVATGAEAALGSTGSNIDRIRRGYLFFRLGLHGRAHARGRCPAGPRACCRFRLPNPAPLRTAAGRHLEIGDRHDYVRSIRSGGMFDGVAGSNADESARAGASSSLPHRRKWR